ncbi:hypothetical protein A9267_05705 [Shewanella sp. UCD-FRSSP16_17]|uniref:DUF2290 domain-containing protein n=1 Tax=Shewanella sp. UCD-FRSSP16_17 TaxID=1853256 RepID=UPI0007EECC28|nr:DUF2290 domain-containing protein [Shewanella sp. UCD-FRSSP16_17]OBT10372.1 hypothetical protein A9267_05705 [Shewanella sp. UCD-FRSSP16_17]
MNNDFSKSISKCINLALELEILAQAGCANSLDASVEFKYEARNSTSYKHLYDIGVKHQDFCLMLFDHSFFQFTENKKDEDLRLVYYPNPYQFVEYMDQKKEALSLFNSGELTLYEYEQIITEDNSSCDAPVIRYDLSLMQHCKNYHPAAHFHIGFYVENRWPVKRILSPYAFFLKILSHYYPKVWHSKVDINNPDINILDINYRKELKECSHLEEAYFQKNEEERLYFT